MTYERLFKKRNQVKISNLESTMTRKTFKSRFALADERTSKVEDRLTEKNQPMKIKKGRKVQV